MARQAFLLAVDPTSRQFNGMNAYARLIPVTFFSVALLSVSPACKTVRPETSTALSNGEKEALLARAKSPQVFGLTAYASEQGAIFAGAFRQHPGHVGRIAFVSPETSTAPIIAINGGTLTMLLDTSSAESWITVEAAVSAGAMAMTSPNPFEKFASHVYDPVGGFAAVLSKLVLDDVHVENGVFYIRNARGPLDNLTRWEKEPYLDGVLGADFFRSFQFVRIGLSGRYIFFSGTDAYPADGKVITRVPIQDGPGGLMVEVMIDGDRKPALIDIAGDYELVLDKPTVSEVRQVSIGDVVFRHVEVDSAYDLGMGAEGPPRIGRQLLEKFDLVINNRGRELLIEKPASEKR